MEFSGEMSYTKVCEFETEGFEVWQCNDCGAYGESKEKIEHYKTCRPGESEHWENFYE